MKLVATALVSLSAAAFLTGATCNKSVGESPIVKPDQPAVAAAPADKPADKDKPADSPGGGGSPPPAGKTAPADDRDKQAELVLSNVPGLDFNVLNAAQKRELATVFTDEFCYCGCPHALGACLKQHGGCKHAKRMALLAASEAAAGTPGIEIINGLSRYYASFKEPRATFKIDDRSCAGPKDAKVTLVEFSDFECPFCAAARPIIEELAKKGSARVCWQAFPLGAHPNAIPAGQAALYAREKGKFWQMHDLLFENQMTLSKESIVGLATSIGLDGKELTKIMDSQKFVDELTASKDAGKAAGVDSTPTVFVNGRKFALGFSSESLQHTIDDEIEWESNKGSWNAD